MNIEGITCNIWSEWCRLLNYVYMRDWFWDISLRKRGGEEAISFVFVLCCDMVGSGEMIVVWYGGCGESTVGLSLSLASSLSRSGFLRCYFFWVFIVFKRNNCVWVSWFWSVKQSLKNWRGMLLLVGVKPKYYTGSLLNLFSLRMYFSHLMKPCKY